MCGIAGLCGPGKPSELQDACWRLVRAQAHRGPDDEGLAAFPGPSDTRAILGSRRLAILDLSPAGHQPMSNEDGTVWVVHNGEVYNFQALRELLESQGHRFRSNTDTEVIVHAYEAYGERCVERFRGMFAFAVWDCKRQQLLLARDRVGEKPLYFAWDGRRLLFASELKALLASGLVEPRPNMAAVRGYLNFGSIPSPMTIIEGVQSLGAGCLLTLRDNQFQIRRYWDIAFEENPTLTEDEAVEGLRHHLQEAVRVRLASDVPLGAFLSGGLDSSAVVALMREAGVKTLRTYSLTFDDPALNEGPFATLVAHRHQTEHTEYLVTPQDVLAELDRFFAVMDQPSVDGLNTYVVAKLTRGSGTVVALSGIGGDELFGGYSTFWHVPRLRRLGRLLGAIPGGRVGAERLIGLVSRSGRMQKLRAFLRRAPSAEAAYLTAKGLFVEEAHEELLAGSWRDAVAPFDPLVYLHDVADGHHEDLLNRVSRLELRTYLHNQLLRDADVMSMAHGLEVRLPLLDHVLIEYVAKLPAGLKFGGTPKRLFVKAMADAYPPELLAREKMGFGFPFERWLRREWRPTVEDWLLTQDEATSHLFDPEGLAALWRQFLAGRIRWSRVWAVVTLLQWLRVHVAQIPSRTVTTERHRAVTT